MNRDPVLLIQILYEIAMSIGNSLDLYKMTKVALSAYMRKLNCSAGAIVRLVERSSHCDFEEVQVIPRNYAKNDAYQRVIDRLAAESISDLAELQAHLPVSFNQKNHVCHALGLPYFGVLILMSSGKAFDTYVVQHLQQVNQKLAEACSACLQNEALFEAKLEAEAADRAKTEFLENMTHEIRTPMNIVVGMADLLIETELDHEQSEYTNNILGATERLMHIIENVFTFSRIIKCQLILEAAPFDLKKVVHETVDAFSEKALDQGLHIDCHYEAKMPSVLVGDKDRIRDILNNLVANAVKFTPAAGKICIRVELAAENEKSASFILSVSDTGIGIPNDKLKSIFEMFGQVDSSRTRKHQGAGMDLAIIKNVVEIMGGRIDVSSSVNQGSLFRIFLTLPKKTQTSNVPISPVSS